MTGLPCPQQTRIMARNPDIDVKLLTAAAGRDAELVADPDARGTGIGRALLDFAEDQSRDSGMRAIQLELLVPREWQHPSKEFLKSWYGRRGDQLVRTISLDDTHPHLAPLLATPCNLEVHEKPLPTHDISLT
jgi:GNAT superfamily N-acetyltransferase